MCVKSVLPSQITVCYNFSANIAQISIRSLFFLNYFLIKIKQHFKQKKSEGFHLHSSI